MASLPIIHPQKPSRSISFDLKGKSTKRPAYGESETLTSKDVSHFGIHGNTKAKDKTTKSSGVIIGDLDKNEKGNLSKTQKQFESETTMNREDENTVVYSHLVQFLHDGFQTDKNSKIKRSNDVNFHLTKMLREKDREISRLREIIRKASLDRENATCADAHSRMRIAELKTKLSSQQRHVEHVTTVEKLRCKEKVSNETERLRHERDDAREQLKHYEKLVWQLRKQVEQLGYLSRQR